MLLFHGPAKSDIGRLVLFHLFMCVDMTTFILFSFFLNEAEASLSTHIYIGLIWTTPGTENLCEVLFVGNPGSSRRKMSANVFSEYITIWIGLTFVLVNWVMIPILAALEWPSMWWCASQKHVDTEILSAVTFSPESVASEVKISEEKRGKLIQICVLETSLLALLTFPWRPVWFLLDCFSCCHTTVGEHPPVISQQIWNQAL